MNKPNMEVRGRNRNRNANYVKPDDELKDLLKGTPAEVAQRAGVSETVLARDVPPIDPNDPQRKVPENELQYDPSLNTSAGVTSSFRVSPLDAVRAEPPLAAIAQQYQETEGVQTASQMAATASVEQATSTVATAAASAQTAAMTAEDAIVKAEDAGTVISAEQANEMFFFMPTADVLERQQRWDAGDRVSMTWEELQKYRVHSTSTAAYYKAPALSEADLEISRDLAERAGDKVVELDRSDKYFSSNIRIVITRFPKGMSDDDQVQLAKLFTEEFEEVSGFRSGFDLHPANSRGFTLERPESMPVFAWQERAKKFLTRYFDAWAVRIKGQGVTEATSFDFFAVELDETGIEVIDAWRCLDMYPRSLGGIESNAYRERPGTQTWHIAATMAGTVERSPSVLNEAVMAWHVLDQAV